MDRALPGPMVDLIRDGAHPADLRSQGQRAVWSALFRTAASCHQRGWDRWEWEALLTEPTSNLGRQAATKDGRRRRTPEAIAKTLAAAWEHAEQWVAERPDRWNRAEAQQQAIRRADLLCELAADPDADLDNACRAVLAHATDRARALTSDRPALPRAQMLAATGLGLTALRSALRRLEEADLLVLAERGRRSPAGGRANLYHLAPVSHPALAPYLYRETRSVVPPGQVCSAPGDNHDGAPAQVCSAPTTEDVQMVTLTLTAPNADALAAALAALRGDDRIVAVEHDLVVADNVRELHTRERKAS